LGASTTSGVVSAEKLNPSADLLVAWLTERLHVEIARAVSKGPGITSVVMHTGGGPIEISRPDGLLAAPLADAVASAFGRVPVRA